MGYGDEQLRELEATIDAVECDVVVTGTPIELGRLIRSASDPPRALRARGGGPADDRGRARSGRGLGNPY